MSGTIGENWDFEHYEKQRKLAEKMRQYEASRQSKNKEGKRIDDYEAATK